MRSKLFIKLLLSLLVTLSAVVLLLLTVINWSFKSGFSDYLQKRELEQLEPLLQNLSAHYQRYGHWQDLRSPRNMHSLLLSSGLTPPPPRHGHPKHKQGFKPPKHFQDTQGAPIDRIKPPKAGHKPPRDTVPLESRLSLFDAEKQAVLGRPISPSEGKWLAIKARNSTVGWLAHRPLNLETDTLAQQFVHHQRTNYLLIAAVVLILAIAVSALWGRLFLHPIQCVIEGSKRLANGDYSSRVPSKGKDELAALAENFNQMATALERTESLRKQWIADISHELRTPIAVLSAEIEALMDGIRQPSPQRIASLYADVSSLTKLVDDLHQLSVSDQGELLLNITPVDLNALTEQHYLLYQPRMEKHGIHLSKDICNTVVIVKADQQRICQVLNNLLENSLRYTHNGGESTIKLSVREKYATIEILDSAPGVPEEDLERIFDRLYRVDKSRARNLGGSGLGLAICKTLITAHQGTLTAEPSDVGGLRMIIRLPLTHK